MRERLTLAFVAVAVVLVTVAILVRAYALSGDLRADKSVDLHAEAASLASAIDERTAAGKTVDATFLARIIGPDVRAVYHRAGLPDVVVMGSDFPGSATLAGNDDLWAVADAAGGRLTMTEAGTVVPDLMTGDTTSLVLLFVLVTLVAGGLGYFVARWLSAPFCQLAIVAAGLGRGRFALDLPRTRIPEARAIASALESSSAQLQERIARERQMAEHASHVLRTPLTSLRLELDDVLGQAEASDEMRAAVERCVQRIDQLDAVTGELVELARHGSLLVGAEIPLRELATQSTQRWADELGQRDRAVTATVEGDLDTSYTPGPVEQILDLVLLDVGHRTRGPVKMIFEAGTDSHLRIVVSWRGVARPHPARVDGAQPLVRARAVAMALGGRLEEPPAGDSVWVRLPRR